MMRAQLTIMSKSALLLLLAAFITVTHAVPPGFKEYSLFGGDRMTDMVWLPGNDYMLVSFKEGIIDVHYPGVNYDYVQSTTRALDIRDNVCTETERGLGSIQLHPQFGISNTWIYMYYTFSKFGNCDRENSTNGPVNRLSRWTYDTDSNTIDPLSEVVLLDTPSTKRPHHNAGNIHFGHDGLLYVSIGDCGHTQEAQSLSNVFGSIVRLTDVGGIPSTNPFANDTDGARCHLDGKTNSGKCQELYAIGLRNPWRFSMDTNSDTKIRFYVNDVGAAKWEEISEGGSDWENANDWYWKLGIQNFGWPVREGPCRREKTTDCNDSFGYIHPLHFYKHDGGGAVTAGTFIPKGVWPSEYDGKYLFADFVFGKLYVLTQDGSPDSLDCCEPAKSHNPVEEFLEWPKIITAKFGPYKNGTKALYYSEAGCCGEMRQVVYTLSLSTNPTSPPTSAPTVSIPPKRPDGAVGGYPGVLFPWKSGNDCPVGYDYCGVLEFCMSAATTTSSMEYRSTYGYRLPCFGAECECVPGPGPLIRLVPGNVYKMTLRNADSEKPTNLHTHGLHIVGSGNGDDVTRIVNGGNCLDYTWNITKDHPGGTHWYHAHFHTLTEQQVGGGAFGMLIVEDSQLLNPTLPAWTQNELLLQISVSSLTDEMVTNGRTNEVIDIAVNQWYRLRVSIVNVNAIPYNFTFDDQDMCDIHKVANDGVWRSTVPGPTSNVWELTGASRADFAIRCNVSDELVPLLYRNDEQVAQLWVTSEVVTPHAMQDWIPNRPYSIKDMSNETVPDANKFSVSLGFDYVNNEQWNATVPLATIAWDQVHEWTLYQTKLHPFHLHMYHLQIVGGCGSHQDGEFYDTISAPDGCTVRFRTADIGQRCVLHCHVLSHEDNGSMSWVNVTGANMPMNDEHSLEYSCTEDLMNPSDAT